MTVHVTGAASSRGVIRVALWREADGFPKDVRKVVQGGSVPLVEGEAIVVLEHVPAGVYAISTYHDENENGKLDTNLVGIPRELFGFSNNARGRMGPPSFNACKFSFSGGGQTVDIKLGSALKP